MKKSVQSSGNCLGIAIALILIAIGISLCFTGIGAILGIPIVFCALFVGGRRRKVWKCRSCGYVFERG
jgi:hypothetical protein